MTGSKSSPLALSLEEGRSAPSPADPPGEEDLSSLLAAELLDAVDSGSPAVLLDTLSRIALVDIGLDAAEGRPANCLEWERLELLRAIAVQLRLDLHAMLMHIHQRVEASRGYLDVARRLAGRPVSGEPGLCNALPRADGSAGIPASPEKAVTEN